MLVSVQLQSEYKESKTASTLSQKGSVPVIFSYCSVQNTSCNMIDVQ